MFLPCRPCCGASCSFSQELSDQLEAVFDALPATVDAVVDSISLTFDYYAILSSTNTRTWRNFDASYPASERNTFLSISRNTTLSPALYFWAFLYRTGWQLQSQTCSTTLSGGVIVPAGDPYNPFTEGGTPAGSDTVKLCGNNGISTVCHEIALPQGSSIGSAGLYPGNPDYYLFTVDWISSGSVIESQSLELPSGWYT